MFRKKILRYISSKINATPRIIDVGARTGLEDNLLFLSNNTNSKIWGFEPEPIEFERLKKILPKNFSLLNTALYSKKQSVTLYVTKSPGLSSLYKPNFDFLREVERSEDINNYEIVNEVSIEANTLDDELKQSEFKNADFIKLDTEGSEVDILKGASELLRNSIIGAEVEISYVRQREGQYTFKDLDSLLNEQNFYLFDTRNKFQKRPDGQKFGKRKGQLIYCDALYFKSIDGIKALTKNMPDNDRKNKIVNAILIIGAYGYFDYAYEIYKNFKDIFDEKERLIIEKSFKKSELLITKIPKLPLRGFIGLILFKLGTIVGASRWDNRCANRFGDNRLGNVDWW